MNKSKDKIMKEFLENNAYFVDFFNAYFFDGERVLKPENCVELDSEMNDSNMDLEKHVDVIRKYNDGNLYSAFIIENQSYADASMVVRAATYEMNDSNMDLEKHVDVIRKYNDGNLYSAFIIENQSYADASMVVRAATYEYVAYERMLKKNRNNKKLPMVNILVFYTGERPWNAARQLSELVEVDERFESYFHDYKMNLIEITGNTSYNFNEEDVYNLFYICRSIYDQSIYEGHDYKMNLIEITGNTSYNFNEEDVYNLFYICRSIYDQSIYEGTSNHFGLVKSSVLKIVKTLTDVEWLDL